MHSILFLGILSLQFSIATPKDILGLHSDTVFVTSFYGDTVAIKVQVTSKIWDVRTYDKGKLNEHFFCRVDTGTQCKRHGSFLSYYDGDTIRPRYQGAYINGQRYGEWKLFYEKGELHEISNYKENKRTGIFISFYPDSAIKELGVFVNGRKVDEWQEYYNNGSLKAIGDYWPELIRQEVAFTIEEGFPLNIFGEDIAYMKNGKWKYYLPDGQLYRVEYFSEGKLVSTTKVE